MRAFPRRLVLISLFTIPLIAFAAREFTMPRTYPAKTYPARDEHTDEKFTIAADPYDTADKADIFTNKFLEHGLMPVFVVFTNDGSNAVSLQNMRVQFTTVNPRTKIAPATQDDIYRRLSRVVRRGDEPSRNPLPIPLPRHPKAGIDSKGRDEIDRCLFRAKAVAPGETQAGFMFFDVEGISQPLAGGHLYVTGVTDGNGKELMYFDIPMEKYLSYTPPGGSK